jgi:ribonuclease HII
MPWLIGIDEAGYGPNLGPFVMTAVLLRVPDEREDADWWHELSSTVRRAGGRKKDRDPDALLIDDSKLVYMKHGLAGLERGVLASTGPAVGDNGLSLAQALDHLAPATHPELRREVWYAGDSALPLEAKPDELVPARERFRRAFAEHGVGFGTTRSVVVCPERFNALSDTANSKGAVLGWCLGQLLESCCRIDDDERMLICVDKHGGRNSYAPLLQDALPGGMVITRKEKASESTYRVLGLRHDMRLTFKPRADSGDFCVALASMTSKYLREALMAEFNRFWQGHVPDLAPTAGYPGDATRFFEAIRPAVQKLGLAESTVWRSR